MFHAKTKKDKIRLFVSVMWPILITQIGTNIINLFDTIMSGRAGTADLAGVAIGSSLWMPAQISVSGILLAVTPIVSQLLGAGRIERIAPSVMQALYLSVVLAVAVIGAGAAAVEPVLHMMQLDGTVHHIAKNYLVGVSFGIVPFFLFSVIRNFFDGQGHTRVTMAIMLFAVPCNIFLNYVMIFGKFGFPRMGGVGAGYATAVTYWIMMIIGIWMCFKLDAMRGHRLFLRWPAPIWKSWKELLSIGVPIGLSVFFEASIFSIVTLLMGSMFDTVTIASHQAATSIGSLMFMIPLSIAMTLTILVGYEIGAGRPGSAKQYGFIGVSAAIAVIAAAAILLYANRAFVAAWFTDEPDVFRLTQHFLLFLIFFQLSDAAQASLQGILRGYKDVTVPFITALISYWFIGIPAGYALSWTALGPFGYWIGITVGLSAAALGFAARLRIVQKRAAEGTGAKLEQT